jgi:hypothetical protein
MLRDESSDVFVKANKIFISLEEEYQLNLNENIEICSQFSFDLLSHFFEEYRDPAWVYQLDNLNDKISKQKEREKQNLIDSLESRDKDSRSATVELQNCGITNWHGDSAKFNLEYIQSETHQTQLENERNDLLKEFLSNEESQLEVLESQGINTDNFLLPENTNDEDESYSQFDVDREDEGDDDGDHDGDYKND